MGDDSWDTLQYYRNEKAMHPLFSSLDALAQRVKEAGFQVQHVSTKDSRNHSIAPAMEEQVLPTAGQDGKCTESCVCARYPILEH